MNSTLAVRLDGLTKRYGRRTVVSQIDLHVETGSVTGLIGPNGAGKTTLMAMMLGLVRPTSGHGTVLGEPLRRPERYLDRVGAHLEAPAFFSGLTAVDNLRYLARLGGHHDVDLRGLIDLVGLAGRAEDRVGDYSLGMKQRLAIAGSLIPDPELVVLDEPSNGVDPVGMRDLRETIRTIAGQGRTVLVSSHLLAELEQVCDRLAVIDRGGLVFSGAAPDLPRSSTEHVRLTPLDPAQAGRLATVCDVAGVVVETTGSVAVPVGSEPADQLAARLNSRAVEHDVALSEVRLVGTDLESRYLSLVHHDHQEEAA